MKSEKDIKIFFNRSYVYRPMNAKTMNIEAVDL